MAGPNGANSQFTLPQILARDQPHLVVRLFKAPLPSPLTLEGVVQADWPGYAPRDGVTWTRFGELADQSTTTITGVARFRFNENAPGAQSVLGVYVTWEPPEYPPILLGAVAFRSPVPLDAQRADMFLRLAMQAYTVSDGTTSGWMMRLVPDVITWQGGNELFALTGYDLAVIRTLLGALDGALRRDAGILDLSERSTRSKIPLVPAGDTQLGAAVTLLQARLRQMLAV